MDGLRKYKYIIANESVYNEQIKYIFNRMIDYHETNKFKKLYPEVINEDYSSMFNYFLSDEYGYEDSEYRNDINEFDDLVSQF